MTMSILFSFYFIFIDGVSEGQFKQVLEEGMQQLSQPCKSIPHEQIRASATQA
jgi:hypothetical protein